MRRFLLFLCLTFAFGPPLLAADTYREMQWDELLPKGWDPAADIKKLKLGKLEDSDPRAIEALEKLRAMWDNAPTDPTLEGVKIRLAGFVIPLEKSGEKVTEFLVVPYFGACIHSPPPPANQIIHATIKRATSMRSMDAFWIKGTLSLHRADTPWGASGYRLSVDGLTPYTEPKKK